MTAATLQNHESTLIQEHEIDAAIESACNSVAPTWPLDRFIAVNPYWGRIKDSFGQVDGDLKNLVPSGLEQLQRNAHRGETPHQCQHQLYHSPLADHLLTLVQEQTLPSQNL